jgi:hypothetical protein
MTVQFEGQWLWRASEERYAEQSCAFYEAGQAVVAYLLDLPLARVWIDPEDLQGGTELALPDQTADPRNEAAMRLGGGICLDGLGLSAPHEWFDFANGIRVLELLAAAFPGDAAAEIAWRRRVSEQLKGCFRRPAVQAAVWRVAKQLLEDFSLDGMTVREIIAAALRDSSPATGSS